MTVEQFLALTSDDITGGTINSASIADTAANIIAVGSVNQLVKVALRLLKITGLSVQMRNG